MTISAGVSRAFDLVNLIIIVTILLSWFPNIKWYNEPFRSLKAFSDIFLAPFRKIIPPLGMIDVSPIVALLALQILKSMCVYVLLLFGL